MTNYLQHKDKLSVSAILQVQVQRFQQRQSALGHHGNQCVSPVPSAVWDQSALHSFWLPTKMRGILSCLVLAENVLAEMSQGSKDAGLQAWGKLGWRFQPPLGLSAFSPCAEATFCWHARRAGWTWVPAVLFHMYYFNLRSLARDFAPAVTIVAQM